eukprot:12625664-Heterocapsa_arctica.AAC.1
MKPKFHNVYGCLHFLPNGIMNIMGVMINYKFYEYSRTAEAHEHLSEETIMNVLSLRTMLGRCLMLFPAIDVHDYMEESKFYNVYASRFPLMNGIMRTTDLKDKQ